MLRVRLLVNREVTIFGRLLTPKKREVFIESEALFNALRVDPQLEETGTTDFTDLSILLDKKIVSATIGSTVLTSSRELHTLTSPPPSSGTASGVSVDASGFSNVLKNTDVWVQTALGTVDTHVDHPIGLGTGLFGALTASAIFEAKSTTRGALLPRMTEAQRLAIAAPATGLIVYDYTYNALYLFNGSAWASLAGGSSANALEAVCLASDAVGDVVRISGDAVGGLAQVEKVDVSDSSKMPGVGVILTKHTDVTCTVLQSGIVSASGLVSGKVYFVSSSGRPTEIPPSPGPGATLMLQTVGVAIDTARLMLQPSFDMIQLVG